MKKIYNHICQQMITDGYQPDYGNIRLEFRTGARRHILASRAMFGRISVFPYAIALDAKKHLGANWRDADPRFGAELVRAIAHEFRHEQQELLWDEEVPLPTVSRVNQENETLGLGPMEARGAEGFSQYWEDPGEKDAREFSERVLARIPERELSAVARLFRRWLTDHMEEQRAAIEAARAELPNVKPGKET